MKLTICDCCKKRIRTLTNCITVSVDTGDVTLLGFPQDEELHFHVDCYTRLKNKVSLFIDEMKGGNEP